MLRQTLLALSLLTIGAGTTSAQDIEEQAFIEYQGARAIDNKCHFLRYFEVLEAGAVEAELLQPLWFSGAYEAGKIDDDEYLAAFNKLADSGKAKVAAIDCADQQAAAPYIIPLRDRISVKLYADLMIAFEGKGLSDEQKQAGHAYEAMIAPLYGENWQSFLDHARRQAQFKIDAARREDAKSSVAFSLSDLDTMFGEEMEAYGIGGGDFYVQSLIGGNASVLDRIFFDLTAAAAGYRARIDRSVTDESAYFTALADAAGNRVYDLLDTPARYEVLEQTGEVYLVLAADQDGAMRVLTWGEGAKTLLATGTVTMLVNPEPLPPEQANDYTYMRSQEWWEKAVRFEAERLDEPCLDAPCFALPADMFDAILAGSANQSFRFYIAAAPGAQPAGPDDLQVHTGYTYALHRWRALKIAEAQAQ